MVKDWFVLLLLAVQHAKASVGTAVATGACGTAESCGAPEASSISSLLQLPHQLGGEAAALAARRHPGEPKERDAPEDAPGLGAPERSREPRANEPPDEPGQGGDGAAFNERLAGLLAHGPSDMSVLETNASRSAAVFSCPGSCQWCNPSYPEHSVVVTSNIKYGQALNMVTGQMEDLFLDAYGVPSVSRKPVLVVVHGGGYQATSTKNGGWAPWVARLLARHGFLAVSIEYRRYGWCMACYKMQPNTVLAHPTLDAKAAVRYVRRNAGLLQADPDKIAMWGCSAGGEVAANAIMFDWGEGDSGNPGFSSSVQAVIALSAAPASTFQRRTSGVAPYLDFHNEVDLAVPYENAVGTKLHLDSIGAPNELITLPGEGHCPDIFLGSGPTRMEDFMGFLTRYLALPGGTCPRASTPAPAPPTPAPSPTPAPPTPAPPTPAPGASGPLGSSPSSPGCPGICKDSSLCRRYWKAKAFYDNGMCVGYCNQLNPKWHRCTGFPGLVNVNCTACKA